jgi:2-polyprenyl-3-methyl-5-hydroxy-6-metoxy-1,4-benzoquinol methylase
MMLATRATQEELMDAPDLAQATYMRVVHDLARVNSITLARRPTLAFIRDIAEQKRNRPLKILDIGFGDGDMLRAIHLWGVRNAVAVQLTGIDLNPRSLAAAQVSTPPSMAIDWRIGDYAELAGEGWDIILSSLVAHHMTHSQLIDYLRFMEDQAHAGWFINDLHRHGFAWLGYPLLATLMRWHPIVRHDGQLSIARSYRPGEWASILNEADVSGAYVSRWFPFRLCVARTR